MSSSSWVTG